MIERHCCQSCWQYELEEDVRIYMTNRYSGYKYRDEVIKIAADRGYDTIVTVVW